MDLSAVCSFTGHRPKGLPWGSDETDPRCLELKATLTARVAELYKEGIRLFISGMAEGVDMMCAEIVLSSRRYYPGMALRCAVPFIGQERGWTEESRRRYDRVLKESGDIRVINERYTPDCYKERNRYLVDNAETLLAVVADWKSGTGGTVAYANKMKRRVIVIYAGEDKTGER